MLIIQKIEDIVRNYEDSRKIVGEFLIKEKRNLNNYSMQKIADMTYTSKSTLVRIAKSLGFSGWNDFIEQYKEEVIYLDNHIDNVDVNFPISKYDTFLQIAGKINTVKTNSMIETLELIDECILNKAISIIENSNRICIFGVSVNFFIAQLFQHKMLMIGKNIEIVSQSEMKFLSYTLSEKDCAIIISYSGNDYNRIPTSLLKILNEKGTAIIGITSLGDNLLRTYSNCTFSISSRERLYSKIASFATESSINLILDIIYACYFSKKYDYNLEYKISVSQKVEKMRNSTSKGIMEENNI